MKSKYRKLTAKLFCFLLFFFIPAISYATVRSKSNGEGGIVGLILILVTFIVLIGGFVGGVMLLTYIVRSRAKKKTIEYCRQNNLNFIEKAERLPIGDDFNLVNIETGKKRKFKNIMVGDKNGIPFILGEYDFKYQEGNSINFVVANFCVMNDDNLNFPNFFLKKNLFVNPNTCVASKFMVGKKIVLEKNKDFSSKYVIKSDSKDSVKAFFDDEIIEVFKNTFPEDCVCEVKNGTIMLYENILMNFDTKIKFLNDSLVFFAAIKSALNNK